MFNPAFWVAAAFVVFVALIFKPVKKFLLESLDSRIAKVRQDLMEAARLKDEAHVLLAKFEKDHRNSLEEVQAILAHARTEAERMTKEAREVLEYALSKRTEMAMQKIAQAEAGVLSDLKNNALDITMDAARTLILENLTTDAAEEILSTAIQDIEKKLH